MKRIQRASLFVILAVTVAAAQDFSVDITFTPQQVQIEPQIRTFAGHAGALDGFDQNDVTGAPPGQTYYSYFSIAEFPNYLWTDSRPWSPPYDQQVTWTAMIVNAVGIRTLVSWDPSQLPDIEGGVFTLNGLPGGPVDMSTSASAEVEGDAELTITYQADRAILTLEVDPEGGGTTTPPAGQHTFVQGEVVDLSAEPQPDYLFKNWSGAVADPQSASTTVTMDESRTVTAHFGLKRTLKLGVFPAEGGITDPAPGSHVYPDGESVTITAQAKSGYRFDSWSGVVQDNDSQTTAVRMDADKTVVANFIKQVALNISADPAEGGTLDPPAGSHEFDQGSVVTLTAQPAAGYRFIGWTGPVSDPQSPATSVTLTGDTDVVARFVRIVTLEMAATPVEGGTTVPAPGQHTYDAGTVVGLTALPAGGYQFLGWDGPVADPGQASTAVTMLDDRQVTAQFEALPVQYTLTLSVNDPSMGTTDPAPGDHSYEEGTEVTVTAQPAQGHLFLRWEGAVADAQSAQTTVVVDGDIEVTAVFEAEPPVLYTLTLYVNDPSMGTTDPAPGGHSYEEGTEVTVTAQPAQGHLFMRWEGAVADAQAAQTTVVVDGDIEVTAVFEAEPPVLYTLTISVNDPSMGTTDPAPAQYSHTAGTVVQIEAIASQDCYFVSWSGGTVSDPRAVRTTVLMNSDVSITAQFARIPPQSHALTVSVNAAGWGTTQPEPGVYSYSEGEVVPLQALPGDGFFFVNWGGEGVAAADLASTSVTMDEDRAVTANFEPYLTHFSFSGATGFCAEVTVPASAVLQINGIPLAPGDEIGAFTPSGDCVGAVVWMGGDRILTVWGDDQATPETEGLAEGETIYFRIWDRSADAAYYAGADFSQGSSSYSAGAASTLSSLISIAAVQVMSVDFSASPLQGTVPLQVAFTDLSTGLITSWQWSFGDNGTSDQANPEHVYSATGTYTVALTVGGPGGELTLERADYITVGSPAPIAQFSADPAAGVAPLQVSFTDMSSGPVTSWSWSFGDGAQSTEQNPSHIYTTPGLYSVTLAVTGPGGSDTEEKTELIQVDHPAPEADFSATPTRGPVPLTVQFKNLSSGEITSWLWDFGDGNSSDSEHPSHDYEQAGSYTVTLTVTGPGGEDDLERVDYITVSFPEAVYNMDDRGVPEEYAFFPVHPNPFNPVTRLHFAVPERSYVSIRVYDAIGRFLETLCDRTLAPGSYGLSWQAGDHGSGLYFFVLRCDRFTAVRKGVLVK